MIMIDAVIVLANLMDADGTLNEESAKRAAKAAEIFDEYSARAIVTCGWSYRSDSQITIADAFRSHLMKFHGISEKDILLERCSRDTVGDAFFTKVNIIEPEGWKSLAVVTSDYHTYRTKEIFEFIYGDGFKLQFFGAAIGGPDRRSSEMDSLLAFKRTFEGAQRGDSGAIYQALRSRHPFYNGSVFPRV